jgi:hypothetical protein
MNDWPEQLRKVFAEGVKGYRAGQRRVDGFFADDEVEFLAELGCSAQEMFDFVEDYSGGGDPSFETVLLVTAIRRDYFLNELNGKPAAETRPMGNFPGKSDELDGIAWLPRIIEKARSKLRGELPPEMMYGCGGDRPFLKRHNINLGDFLRFVWRAGDDTQSIVDYVKNKGATP